MVDLLEPVQQEYQRIRADRGELDRILAQGADRARAKATVTVQQVYDALGFVPPARGS